MVRAGEAAGNLDEVLMRLADFLEAQNALRAKITGALIYPIVMMVVGVDHMGVLMIVVVPKITAMFEDPARRCPGTRGSHRRVDDRRQLLVAGDPVGGIVLTGRVRRWSRRSRGRSVRRPV